MLFLSKALGIWIEQFSMLINGQIIGQSILTFNIYNLSGKKWLLLRLAPL